MMWGKWVTRQEHTFKWEDLEKHVVVPMEATLNIPTLRYNMDGNP
jgi:hypothetical protein